METEKCNECGKMVFSLCKLRYSPEEVKEMCTSCMVHARWGHLYDENGQLKKDTKIKLTTILE